jgi:hypothetical protein
MPPPQPPSMRSRRRRPRAPPPACLAACLRRREPATRFARPAAATGAPRSARSPTQPTAGLRRPARARELLSSSRLARRPPPDLSGSPTIARPAAFACRPSSATARPTASRSAAAGPTASMRWTAPHARSRPPAAWCRSAILRTTRAAEMGPAAIPSPTGAAVRTASACWSLPTSARVTAGPCASLASATAETDRRALPRATASFATHASPVPAERSAAKPRPARQDFPASPTEASSGTVPDRGAPGRRTRPFRPGEPVTSLQVFVDNPSSRLDIWSSRVEGTHIWSRWS